MELEISSGICIYSQTHTYVVFQHNSYSFLGVVGWQNDEFVIFVTLVLSAIVLSPGHVGGMRAKDSDDLICFSSPFFTHHCNMNNILGDRRTSFGDRGVINYKNASVPSFKSLFPIIENKVPCPFCKSYKYVHPEQP